MKVNNKPNKHLFDIYYQSSLVHPNIIVPKEIYSFNDKQFVVFEKPNAVRLSSLIESDEFNGAYQNILDIVQQLLSIVSQLNNLGFMHRNLNSEIIYINKYNNKVFLQELGTCTEANPTKQKILTNLLFTSPEMANYNSQYDKKTDLYSIGVIFFLLLYGHGP